MTPDVPRPSELLAVFFGAALVQLATAAAAAVAYALSGDDWLYGLALHLILLAVPRNSCSAPTPFFVCAFRATDPTPRRLIAAQWLAWNAGSVLIAVAVPTAIPGLVETGAALLAAALSSARVRTAMDAPPLAAAGV